MPNRSAKKMRNCYISVKMGNINKTKDLDDISTLKAYPKTLLDSAKKKKLKKKGN